MALVLGLGALAQTTVDTARAEVLLETTMGNIRVQLYNETPLHRDNFLKLTRLHFYDSLLFHRVIEHFMIQTGDPSSKNAEPGVSLGNSSLDYTIPAEIRFPQYYHKRGALAAAREGDDVNPKRESSGSHFYIVWGKRFSSAQMEDYQWRLDTLFADSVKMPEEMVKTYRWVGGTPHLDGTYTVFGEVVEGFDVVEKIQATDTDDYDRPIEDVRIIRATIVKGDPNEAEKKKSVPMRRIQRRR